MRIGIAVGLFLAGTAGCGKPAGPESPAEKSPLVVVAAKTTAPMEKRPPADYADWGPFAGLPKAVGPGSGCFAFASVLWRELKLDDSAWWGIDMPLSSSRAAFHVSVPARFGTHAMCLVNTTDSLLWPDVTLAFDGYPITELGTPEKSQDGLRQMMQAIGKSLKLGADDLRRIDLIVARIPIAQHSSGEGAIKAFVAHLPLKAHTRMLACLMCQVEPKKALRPSFEVPTIGFTLSDALAMELVFGLSETLGAFDQKAREIGTCWSLRIASRRYTGYTSLKESEAEPDGMTLFWPRLTLAEVDEMISPRTGPFR